MITKEDINIIFSTCYAEAALRDDTDMRNVADLFESIREQVNLNDPFDWWDFIITDARFNNEVSLELLISLKETYYRQFYKKIITNLNTVYKNDEAQGTNLWKELFVTAAVHYKDDLMCLLCNERKNWKNKKSLPGNYLKIPNLIREGRWVDVYPFYEEIAAIEDLSNEVRGFAELTLLQIILYHYPEYSRALKHIESAALLLPDHFMVKRGWAQYFLKTGETQKARDGFLSVIAEKPGDYFSFNAMGDCFALDSMLENAESWYKDAMQKNFIQSESYQRLITLYADKKWFEKKEPEYEALLSHIEKRQMFQHPQELIEKKIAPPVCFNDASLYQSYREVGAAWYANDNLETSEWWYQKASTLQPTFTTALIDIAYLTIYKKNNDEAKRLFLSALELDKDNFEVYWGLAYLYEILNEKEEALKAYKTCLRLRPHWSDSINNQIGKLYYSGNEYKTAEDYFRKAMKANGNYIIYRQNVADAMQSQAGQLVKEVPEPKAERLYITAAELADDDIRWNVVGNYYFKIKQWAKAIEYYNKAISLKDNNPIYYENRGLAFENMNQLKEAEESYKQALHYDSESGRYFNRLGVFYYVQKDYEQSIIYYQQALDREPEEPVYLDNITLAFEQMNQLDKAEPYYYRLLKISPANDKILNRLGVLYFKENKFEKALEYYDKAIEHNNQNDIYFENKAVLFRAMKKDTEAIAEFEKALQINPKNDVNWNDAAVLYFNAGNFDKAIEYYGKAIELKPGVSLYYENLGLAYEKKERLYEAIDNYKKALEITPGNARLLNATGVIYYNLQDFVSAIEYYKKAVDMESDNWIYQTNLGLALRLSGRADEAIEVYEKAIALKDDDYLNWNELGVLLAGNGNYDEAIDAYKKSINLNPNDAVLYLNLALALNATGKLEEATRVTEGYP
ncbi:MAG TPA: tetratricopeptide repeat protein, partial [Hanamia sp.]|nr:tetratricopeptide repeat protein [Hanamia sp.]